LRGRDHRPQRDLEPPGFTHPGSVTRQSSGDPGPAL